MFPVLLKWLPLSVLVLLALAFEPLRSGFELANQACEFVTTWERVVGSLFNLRHIIGYGSICLAALVTLQNVRPLKVAVATFVFSVVMELQQSFFITGHCRAWDLVPNLVAVGLALALFALGRKLFAQSKPVH